jgi:hypothetical protein
MSRKHLPAAAPVSIGCSVALRLAPRAHTADNVLQVADASRKTVDPVTMRRRRCAQEVEHGCSSVRPPHSPHAANAASAAAGSALSR